MTLTQSPGNCGHSGHDRYTYQVRVSWFRDEWKQTDTTDCSTLPASAVGNQHQHSFYTVSYGGSAVECLLAFVLTAWFHLQSLVAAVNRIQVVAELEVTRGHVEMGSQHQVVTPAFLVSNQHVLLEQVVDDAREMPCRELVLAFLRRNTNHSAGSLIFYPRDAMLRGY